MPWRFWLCSAVKRFQRIEGVRSKRWDLSNKPQNPQVQAVETQYLATAVPTLRQQATSYRITSMQSVRAARLIQSYRKRWTGFETTIT